MIKRLNFQAWLWGVMHSTGAQKRQLISIQPPIRLQWVWLDCYRHLLIEITPTFIRWEGVPFWLLHEYLRQMGWTAEEIDELFYDEMPF